MKKGIQALGLFLTLTVMAVPLHGGAFSDQEIVNAARAYLDIIDVREYYQERFEAVDDPEALAEMQTEANIRIMQALENNAIDAEAYNALIDAAQEDADLMEDLLNEIDRQESIR